MIFDTRVRNADRYPPIDATGAKLSNHGPNWGNVLLVRDSPSAKRLRIVATDFSEALVAGRNLTAKSFGIAADKDEAI